MSNDLIVPGLAGAPSARFDEMPIEQEKIGTGIGVGLGYSVIGASGKQFKLQYQGDSYMLTADSREHFEMVILRGGEVPSHTWYKQGYQPGSEQPPDCSSTDGIAPDDASPSPQSDLCQTCPRHEWKMQKNGRKGRECSDHLRLAIYPVSQNLIEKAIGHRLSEPVMFRIPAASMKGMVEFMDQVRARHRKVASYGYVTRVKMRQDVPHAQYTYQVAAWLTDEQVDQMKLIREEPVAYRILGQTPEGHSLVRQAANQPQQLFQGPGLPHPQQPPPQETPRNPEHAKVIEAKAEEIVIEKAAIAQGQQMKPIEDAPADMDALVAAMRPRPPQQG